MPPFVSSHPVGNSAMTHQDHDPVEHPKHYCSHPSGIECIEITRHMNFNCGNVIKYLWRCGLKDSAPSIEDLRKAAWYLNDEINRVQGALKTRGVMTENGEVLPPLEVLHVDGKPATWEDLLPGDVIEEVAQNLANTASVPAETVDGKSQYSLTVEYEKVDDEWDFERGWTNGEVVLWKGEIYRFHSGIAEDSPVKLCSVEPSVSNQWTHLGPVKKPSDPFAIPAAEEL